MESKTKKNQEVVAVVETVNETVEVAETTETTETETTETDPMAAFAETVKAWDGQKVTREANKLRNLFIEKMGLPKAANAAGYKQGEKADETMLLDIIELRDNYETICVITGKYYAILEKMNRNLRNSDRASRFMALEREAQKKKTGTTDSAE